MIREEKIEFTTKWCKYIKYVIEKKNDKYYILPDKNAKPSTYDPFEIKNQILKDLLVIGKESVDNEMFKLGNKEVSIEALSKIEKFQKLVLEFVNKYGLLGNFRFLLESYEFMDNGELPVNLGYNTSINALDFENMKAVNTTLINLYWGIGEEIYNQQQEKCWGKSIVEVLSKEIQKEFPEVKGFSASNLWRMRNFYLTYKDIENLAPLVREISWTKNIVITEKCKDNLEREFYIKMTKNMVGRKMY